MSLSAYVLINIEAGKPRSALAALKKNKDVRSAHLVTGLHDAIALIEAPDVNKLGTIVTESVQKITGVQRTVTCICVETE
ncbi:MAG: Lrp/AsnC ligand binding domain-containing protein [Planctomycetota bacterium]|nr:Lrp/AsnC ligand binding domain-containing protein [Planctomycetota bacterium]